MRPPDYREQRIIADLPVTLRTLRPEDRAIEEAFVRALSPTSRYLRFHNALPALTPEMTERFLNLDYPDQMALIASVPDDDGERQIAVARWARAGGEIAADLGIAVADDWQGKGLGTALLKRLLELAATAGIEQITANVLYENQRMRALARDLGFHLASRQDDPHTLLLIRSAGDHG